MLCGLKAWIILIKIKKMTGPLIKSTPITKIKTATRIDRFIIEKG